MSAAEKPKPEQIQANVAAALSRLRGELGASGTPAVAPRPATEAPEPKLGPVVSLPAGPVRAPEESRGLAASRPFEPTLSAARGMPAPEAEIPADNDAPGLEVLQPADFLPGRRGDSSRMDTGRMDTGRMDTGRMDSGRVEPTLGAERAAADQPDLLAGMEVPPAPPPPLGALDEDLELNERRRKRRNRTLALVAVLVVVVGAGWAFLRNRPAEGPPPVITADTSPEKVKPADEGGMQVPNQNVQILDNLSNGQPAATAASAGNATVLPAPEQPIAPPAAEQSTQASPAPGAPAVTETPPAAPATDQAQSGQAPAAATQTDQTQTDQSATADAAAPSVAAPAIPSVSAPAVPGTTPSAGPATQTAAPEPAKPAATQTAAVPAQAPAAKPVPAGSAKVQLAAVRSEAAARALWIKLQKAHSELLGALSLNIDTVDKSGVTYYRVQAGPLRDKAIAKQLCAKLAAQKQDCIVAR